jgi:glycosyltransferase involved in cell wall biosynthesis
VTRCCLVVTTYERPDALARVLEALEGQSHAPHELLVADDGSAPATARVVESHAARVAYPVRHVWQPHDGFRAGRARNAAIGCTDCDYVVLLDGDMVPHPEFLADHLALARSGHYSQGVRILLDADATRRLLEQRHALPGLLAPGLGGLRRFYAVRSPAAARRLRYVANQLVAVKACNQGFWRDDLLRVNGFDESITGWGAEDKELCARLDNAGVRRQTLLFAAAAWHLAHAPAARDRAMPNRDRWRETVRSKRTRCDRGIDGPRGDVRIATFPSGAAGGPLL